MGAETTSPWLAQLRRTRPVTELRESDAADVAIIGGGIAGISTAYFVLERTDLDVVLLEKDLVAGGATGHNAGQVVAAFEVPYPELVERYGAALVEQGLAETFEGWKHLRDMLKYIDAEELLQDVQGHLALSSLEDLQGRLEEGAPAGTRGQVLIADDIIKEVPSIPKGVRAVTREGLLEALWSRDPRYIAAMGTRVGTINSAMLAEKLAERLAERYGNRFRIYERSAASSVRLGDRAAVKANGHAVHAGSVVMCTNGYPEPRYEACAFPVGKGAVRGVEGYMIGKYSSAGSPGVKVFFPGPSGNGPYYYVTRRRFGDRWLTSAGGPDLQLRPGEGPEDESLRDEEFYGLIEGFMARTVQGYEGPRDVQWKGLMGYTSPNVRLVGQDPGNGALYYNLGCNGIGILTSVAGGLRISRLLEGEVLPPSMFDPALLMSGRKASSSSSSVR